ncbi:hypothetical protein TCAL_13967 [Tigriopus californicus]|uniref:F5/8 type C domain-containing protein n=1 Tax=Tigriopus californicus TaxID=6832 RepID=A0A553PGP1_TIGCA|nr:hypothetical protein TCAL_13967 [Tigriopus californicus]
MAEHGLFVLALLGTFVPCKALKNVVIEGTTMRPNFIRKKVSLDPLPIRIPLELRIGSKCCSHYQTVSWSRVLEFYDPFSECVADWIPCPYQDRKCIANIEPAYCPPSHPQAVEQGCCATSQGSSSLECLGSLNEKSPMSCCQPEDFIFIKDCYEKRRPCLSSKASPYPQPIILYEETRGTHFAERALQYSTCDIFLGIRKRWDGGTTSKPHFIFDFTELRHFRKVILRNGHGERFHDRGTRTFVLSVSNTSEPFLWVDILSDTLPKVEYGTTCEAPLVNFTLPGDGISTRYGRFMVTSDYRYGASLNYLGFE